MLQSMGLHDSDMTERLNNKLKWHKMAHTMPNCSRYLIHAINRSFQFIIHVTTVDGVPPVSSVLGIHSRRWQRLSFKEHPVQ